MYRCSQSDVIGLRLDDFLEVQRCGFMFMVRRILEIVKIHWFFHEKKVVAENLASDTISRARSSSRPEDLSASGAAGGLLPNPREAPVGIHETG